MSLPRMRTAAGVLVEIKSEDPNTEVTLHYIRQLIHTNQIPVVPVGRKKLVNVDDIVSHLTEGRKTNIETAKIRRVI